MFVKKSAALLCDVLKGILFIGFSLQIIFGVMWMCFHFAAIQEFGQAPGFLYPLLLQLFGEVPWVLYLLQLGVAGYAAVLLIKPVFPSGVFRRGWCVLALLTVPMSLQCHMALLPYSFVSSLLFLEIVFCRSAVENSKGVSALALTEGCGSWLVLALLLPEYSWLGGIPLVLTLLFRLRRVWGQWRQLAYSLLIIAAFGGMIAGVGSLTRVQGTEDRRTFWFCMASRMSWPTIWNDAARWSEDLWAVTEKVIWETSYRPDNMEKMLQPVIESAVGAKQAQIYYREIAEKAWWLHKSRIVRQMGWDALIYAAPQAVLQAQFGGVGYDSYSGRNYDIMVAACPRLTKYYVAYSCWWFFVSLGSTVLLAVADFAETAGNFPRKKFAFVAACGLSGIGIVLYYVMQGAGIADYKRTAAVSSVWTLLALYCMGRRRLNEGE